MIDNEIIMTLEMNFTFEQVRVNEMWIVCFGSQGLRVYNWQQELFWKWEKEEEVSCLHLEPTRLIFSTPVGKVGFYNFYDSKLQEVQAIKETFSMEISVLSLPKLPTKNSRSTHVVTQTSASTKCYAWATGGRWPCSVSPSRTGTTPPRWPT